MNLTFFVRVSEVISAKCIAADNMTVKIINPSFWLQKCYLSEKGEGKKSLGNYNTII